MGSRAVLLVRRDSGGAIHTRTGRAFFGPPVTAEALTRLAAAAEKAGLFESLATDWLLLDAEILPWSAKAGELIRDQYASVGAAAGAVLPVAVGKLAVRTVGGAPLVEQRQDLGFLLGQDRVHRRAGFLVSQPAAGPAGRRDRVHRGVPALRLADRRAGRGAGRAVPAAGERGRDVPGPAARLAPGPGRPAGRR